MAKGKKTGGGTRKGSPNKENKALREMILGALDIVGGEKYLAAQAKKNPSAFLQLIGKVLPMQVTGAGGGPVETEAHYRITFVGTESNKIINKPGGD